MEARRTRRSSLDGQRQRSPTDLHPHLRPGVAARDKQARGSKIPRSTGASRARSQSPPPSPPPDEHFEAWRKDRWLMFAWGAARVLRRFRSEAVLRALSGWRSNRLCDLLLEREDIEIQREVEHKLNALAVGAVACSNQTTSRAPKTKRARISVQAYRARVDSGTPLLFAEIGTTPAELLRMYAPKIIANNQCCLQYVGKGVAILRSNFICLFKEKSWSKWPPAI